MTRPIMKLSNRINLPDIAITGFETPLNEVERGIQDLSLIHI